MLKPRSLLSRADEALCPRIISNPIIAPPSIRHPNSQLRDTILIHTIRCNSKRICQRLREIRRKIREHAKSNETTTAERKEIARVAGRNIVGNLGQAPVVAEASDSICDGVIVALDSCGLENVF